LRIDLLKTWADSWLAVPCLGSFSESYEYGSDLGGFSESYGFDLGGCGWSHCVTNCTDVPGGAQVYPCGPAHPLCPHSATKPTYKFHLADPTCDINDPNGP
jgi:hypothetical protein